MATSTTTLRVRYAETDQMRVAYHAHYFVWFEVARCELLRTLGWSYREMEETGVLLPVTGAECEYKQPARYDDDIEIRTEGRLLSPVRMTFTYELRILGREGLSASGCTRHAAVDQTGKPCRLPHRIIEVFS